MRSPVARKMQGTVIITVLMMVAVATFLVVEITYRQRIDIVRTGTLLAMEQSFEYVKSAEALAQYILREDIRGDINGTDIRDVASEDWATPVTRPIGRGTISGSIEDLQGRFNINVFLSGDSGTREFYQGVFVDLLGNLGIPSDTSSNITALSIAERVIDWVDTNTDPKTDGLESQEYLLLDPPYQTGDRMVLDISELLLVTGLERQDIELLANHVSFLPTSTLINVNTASEELLTAIPCLTVSAVSAVVDDNGFGSEDVTTLLETTGGYIDADCTTTFPSAGVFSANSEFFMLRAEASIDNRTVRMHSILYRTAAANVADVVIPVIIQRKHLDPFTNV